MADMQYIIVKNRNYAENGPFGWLIQEDMVGGDNIAAFDKREHANMFLAWLNSKEKE